MSASPPEEDEPDRDELNDLWETWAAQGILEDPIREP